MVKITRVLRQRPKNPEMRRPTPSFKYDYKAPKAEPRPTSATGMAYGATIMKTTPKPDDSPARAQLRTVAFEEVNALKTDGLLKPERIMTTAQSPRITIKGNQLRILNFCSNNYLGLSNHPDIVRYSKDIMVQYGAGLSSMRHICGTQDIHKDLEKALSKFHGREDTMLYSSCYDANRGLFDALLTSQDAVFADEESHASIKDGIEMCRATKHTYKHLDMEDLEKKLQNCTSRLKLIATDGAFPTTGELAPMKDLVELAEKYQALTFVDESHSIGLVGKTGLGSEEHFDVKGRIDIINSSLSKALGGTAGGYTTSTQELITLLRQKSRPYLFANSLSPGSIASATLALDMLTRSCELVEKLQENSKKFRSGMEKAGFKVLGEDHPICPVIVGDMQMTNNFADKIQWRQVFVAPLTYPLVPKDQPRIRVHVSAAHSKDEIDRALEAFTYMGKLLKVV